MTKYLLIFALILSTMLSGCSQLFNFTNPFSGGSDRIPIEPNRVSNPTNTFSVAIGGVADGRDEIVIYDASGNPRNFIGDTLSCEPADDNLVSLRPRPGYETQADGSGVQVVALEPGITAINCKVGDVEMDEVYEVTIPPQTLIQILVAEAATQIADEATIEVTDGVYSVALGSESPTASTLASVIRNRIEITNEMDDEELFGADEYDYDFDPPASYYDEIILAEGQFSPTDRDDPNFDVFWDAELRKYMQGDYLIAYDQAVITAADVFNGDVLDDTGGAFGFRSPSVDEWEIIAEAWSSGSSEIPPEAGFTDESFPSLAPIQILIHPDMWVYGNGRPAFIFARERFSDEFAIEDTP